MQTMIWRGHAIQAAQRTLSLLLAIVLMGTVTLVSAAPAFAQEDDATEVNDTPIEEILTNTDEYMDTLVSVTGRVGQILTPRAFVLGAQNAADPQQDDGILITGAAAAIPADLAYGDLVEVTGTVRDFAPAGDDGDPFGEEVDINPDAEVYADFHDDPTIVAHSITPISSPGEDDDEIGDDEDITEIPLTEIFNDFDLFEGERVRVSGEVEDIIGNSAVLLSVDDANEDLLVVAEASAMPDWMIEGA
ncbi:MAG: hypothetical protein M3173_06155, partial [Chloroflexota bacterium]|nr:hypothetical protein [Chloroflexota bacterium]